MRRRMLRDRLTRSAFELGPGRKPDGEAPSGLTVWSRDISQFAGRPDDGLALDGDTVTALVGGTTAGAHGGWRGSAGAGLTSPTASSRGTRLWTPTSRSG